MWRSPLTIPGSDVPAEDFIGRAGRYRLDNVGVGEKQMQYCPNCMIQIRGRKARCPLCQRELMDPDSWTEPELGDGCVDLNTARILYNPEKYTASFVTDSYNGHSDSGEIKVFFIDFKAVNERETTFEFEIEIK